VRVGFTPIRVVCANTLAMAHQSDASKLIRIKHSRTVNANLDNIRNVIDTANNQFEATLEQYKLLARKSINQGDLKKYVKKVLKIEEDEELSTRSQNQISEIVKLFETGRGNDLPSVRGTMWCGYNAVTQWLSYDRGGDENRLNSLWFGDSANVNKTAFELALEMAA
jgi:phage/plasmid-like protein (TIGR03299 family)